MPESRMRHFRNKRRRHPTAAADRGPYLRRSWIQDPPGSLRSGDSTGGQGLFGLPDPLQQLAASLVTQASGSRMIVRSSQRPNLVPACDTVPTWWNPNRSCSRIDAAFPASMSAIMT